MKSNAKQTANNVPRISVLNVELDIKMKMMVVVNLILAAIQVANFVLKEPIETTEIIIAWNVLIIVPLVTVQLVILA